jgi:hypothetical protein
VDLILTDLQDMEQPDTSRLDSSEEHLAWAVSTVVEALPSFDPGRRHQEMIHPRDRMALYARLLVSHFQGDRRFVASVLRELRRHRGPLEDLLAEKGPWANCKRGVVNLEDAILLEYDGLSHPAAFQQLWDEVGSFGSHVDGLAEALASAKELASDAGLRSPWGAPMILGAWLRHLVSRSTRPAYLGRHSFRLWPSGPRAGYRAPSTISTQNYWDPESRTRDVIRAEIMKDVDAKLDSIIGSYEAEGYERVTLRKVRRDVAATYLRISDPEQWSWQRLSGRYEDEDATAIDEGVLLLSSSGVRSAVIRVMRLLEIKPPTKRPGRPRTRP